MNLFARAATWLKNRDWLLGTPKTADYKAIPHNMFQQPRDLPVFTFHTIHAMLMDPTVRLGLAMRMAPLTSAEFAFKQGTDERGQAKWVPGVQAKKPEVAEFVLRQLQRIWQHDLPKILSAQIWGWAAGEVVLRLTPAGMVEFDTILHRHARDVRPLLGNGEVKAVRFLRVRGTSGNVELRFPKSYWHVFRDDEGSAHNMPVLHGAYSPWADKWLNGGALDVRRLFMHMHAYGGNDLTYPPGTTDDGEGNPIPNRDIARQIVEQLKAGGSTTRPAQFEPNTGKPMWELTRATVPANPTHILEYPKDLDVEILRGMEIPDDVLTSEGTGAWQGKQVPMQAFFSGLNTWLTVVVRVTVKQIIEPLVLLNWGKPEEFEVMTKPLDVQAMEINQRNQPEGAGQGGQPGQPGQPQPGAVFGQPGQQPGQPVRPGQPGNGQGQPGQPGVPAPRRRFGLDPMDPVQAVGEGVLSAGELVTAAKEAMRIRLARPFDESKISREGKGTGEGGQFAEQAGADVATEKKVSDRVSATIKDKQLTLGSGESLPGHLQGLRIPPAWRDITISLDPNAALIATGFDAKGRKQSVYSAAHSQSRSAMKFSRITELRQKFSAIQEQNRANIESESPLVRDAASVSSLIMATGLRPGSTRDTKAETQAFGATTLEGRHVVVSGTNVRLKFTGKKGVPIDIPVNNPMVAALLRERKESAGDSGRLFNVSDSQLRGYAKTLDGGSFKPKDFRTHKGTSLAANLVSRGSVPKSEKEYKSRVREVAKSVAAALGNTPAVALQSYIDPTVFSKWRPAA